MPAPLARLLAAAGPPAEPDADLLARFVAARDDDAFAELVRRHGPAVYHTCRRLVGPHAAADAFQATFLVLAARAGAVRKAASVGSWLVGVAGRVGRKQRARDQRTEDRRQAAVDPNQLPAPGSPPDLCLLTSDLCSVLADEFSRLPDRLRAAAVACLLDGRTHDQAAAALGWSARTVRRRLDEAKTLLRERLERRGVAPAAALAAVTGVDAAAAVPAGLARTAIEGAALFVAGGGGHAPAAALAHGVIATMTTMRTTAAAACAAVLAGLGFVWAGDGPAPAAATKAAEPERIPARAAPAAFTHRTANFVVEAPTAAAARALGEEFELQRKTAAVEWLGKELPKWKEPVTARFERHPEGGNLSGIVRFRAVPKAEFETGAGGRLDELLARDVRWWATQFVLVTHFEGHPPRWAADVVAHLDDPEADQREAFREARRQLDAGEALRLRTLFEMTAPPRGTNTAPQSFTVARFLLQCKADPRVRVFPDRSIGHLDADPEIPQGHNVAKRALLTFLETSRMKVGDLGARLIYRHVDVNHLEEMWIDWLRVQTGSDPVTPADPDRIPPPGLAPPPAAPRATAKSKDFVVTAPSAEVAGVVREAAGVYLQRLAKEWLGKELPYPAEAIPITVVLAVGGSGGATTFTFAESDGKRPPRVKAAAMEVRGPLDTIMKSVLPHEVMHVVLATHFGRPLPRWADEGIAVLAESASEQRAHDIRARELLNAGRAIRLATLFRMTEYPRDTVVTFAQGYSVCRFLLDRGPIDAGERRAALLAFVGRGIERNTPESWAEAAKAVYGFDSVDALERAWIDALRDAPAGANP